MDKRIIIIVFFLITISIVVFYWTPVRVLWLYLRPVNREMVNSQITIAKAEPVLINLDHGFRKRAGSCAGIVFYFPQKFQTSPCIPCIKLPSGQTLDISVNGLDKRGHRYNLKTYASWHDDGKPVLFYKFDPQPPWNAKIVQLEFTATTNVVIDHIKWLDGLWK